jgi:glycosyltransferase involved in cell wall biosynthesis
MRKLKIIQCLVFYLPIRIGGIEVYVHSLNRLLKKMGHDVKVLVPNFPGETPYNSEFEGISILTYEEFNNTSPEEFGGNVPGKGLPVFIDVLREEKPDIVHFHQLTSSNGISLFHIEAAKTLGIKVIYTNHLAGLTCQTGKLTFRNKKGCDGKIRDLKCAVCDLKQYNINEPLAWMLMRTGRSLSFILPGLQNNKSKTLKPLLHFNRIREKRQKVIRLLELADRFIVITDWYHNVLKQNNFDVSRVRVIKQALPISNRYVIGKNLSVDQEILKLVFIGRIFPDKGLLVLLKALSEMSSINVSLDIYGQVDDNSYFQKCKELHANSNNITYKGHISSSEIVSQLRNYHLLILPSIVAEMAPLVIQEAFAAGVPVVGSNIGGIAEEIKDGQNGLLFEMGNSNQLKNILESLIKDRSLLSKMSGQISIPMQFDVVAEQVEQQYMDVLKD